MVFYDPGPGRPIATLKDDREARAAAEARVRELEELLRLRNP